MAKIDVGRFPKGVSGNPAGRPKGSKNKFKIAKRRDAVENAIMKAAGGEAEALAQLMRTCIADAQFHENEGFMMQNRKLVFDKLLPSTAPPKADHEAEDNVLTIKIGTVRLGDTGVVEKAIEGELVKQETST